MAELVGRGRSGTSACPRRGRRPSAARTPSTRSPRCRASTRSGGASRSSEVLPICRELGIGFVPFSPLGRGFLTGTVTDDGSSRRFPRAPASLPRRASGEEPGARGPSGDRCSGSALHPRSSHSPGCLRGRRRPRADSRHDEARAARGEHRSSRARAHGRRPRGDQRRDRADLRAGRAVRRRRSANDRPLTGISDARRMVRSSQRGRASEPRGARHASGRRPRNASVSPAATPRSSCGRPTTTARTWVRFADGSRVER